MCNLQMEELEPRQLLDGTGFSPQPPLWQPSAAVAYAAFMVAERSPFVDYGGHARPLGWSWSGEGGVEVGPYRSYAHLGFDGRGPDVLGPHVADHQSPGAARPKTWASSAIWVDADHAGPPGPNPAGGSAAARGNTGGIPPALLVPANSNRAANGASAEAFFAVALEQPNPQLHPLLQNPLGARGLPIEMQGLSAVRSPVEAVRGEQGYSGSAGNLREESWKRHNRSGMSGDSPAVEELVLPSPKVSDVLAVLPPFELSGLELGMQHFLEQLERLGTRLAMDGDRTGLWPWIVAVASAASACEIARREVRRRPGVPAVEANGMSNCSSDLLIGGRS